MMNLRPRDCDATMYSDRNHIFIDQDTIAAIATPVGTGGIGIIRISGKRACSVAKTLFKRSSGNPILRSHQLHHGHILDPINGTIIDEVLLTVMKAPRSYTREDVVEIQSHSGPIVLSKILELVLSNGARMAEAGEFTRRAFLNGRIDLSQAEAVAEMITARNKAALSIASDHLSGKMKGAIENILDQITSQMAMIEAGIEFPEEIEEDITDIELIENINKNAISSIETLIKQYEDGHVVRDGLRLSVVGRPNVGKSSLLNYLIEKERAIVTPIAGTTRDLIEETFNICGIPIIISDTAGLHSTEDIVEIIGIRKTRENMIHADIILFVVDGTMQTSDEEWEEIYKIQEEKNTVLVINKIDLIDDEFKVQVPPQLSHLKQIKLSALTGQNVDRLKKLISKLYLNETTFQTGHAIIPNLRQKELLERAKAYLLKAVDGIKNGETSELIVYDLDAALKMLKGITGEIIDGDILDQIFSRFCIGK